MIKSWSQFIKEFVNSESYIDTKMQELKDLVDSISDKNIIYEWQNKNDHQLTISFSTSTLSIKYEFDIDELKVMKIAGDVVDFDTEVESIDEGIDIIEKDIQSILGISEELRFTKSERRSEELSKNLNVRNFVQRFHKIRNQKLRNLPLEHKPTWSNVEVFFSDVEGDRDWWLTHLNIPREKHKSGLICAKWNDVTCFFKSEIQSDTIVYTYDSYNLTNFNPPLTSEGKMLIQDFIELCKSTTFALTKDEVPTRFNLIESMRGEWSSSLTISDSEKIIDQIVKFAKINVMDNTTDSEGLVTELEEILMNYDKQTVDLVVDTILFCDPDDRNWIEWATDEIIKVGDKIMSKYGTEPKQVMNAYETAFNFLKRNFNWDDEVNERTKAQRYKGRKIPGKYLTKNPGKMKKEIDTFRGRKEYKKDWDADYKSGKGGEGKRVKTKKSAATKAYQKMFGDK